MADAEIIPLGTRGRPGRGSSSTPSRAARSLAPPVSRKRPAGRAPPSAGGPGPEQASDQASDLASDQASDQASATRAALAFLRRRLTGDYEVDETGFDPELTSTVLMSALRPLAEHWFRIEVRGAENVPRSGGALLVSNHSGTLPLDALMLSLVVHDHVGRHLRALGADLVFELPFVSELARRLGVTLACNEDAERLLTSGELVGVWPEGFKGLGKPYSERYKLQRFGRGGFVTAALRTGVPIVPCSVVGAEEIYPLVGTLPTVARLLGVPYVPVTPLFPLLGPLGLVPLPSRWIIEFGEPIHTETHAAAEEDPMLVMDLTDEVRERIQHSLFGLLKSRGHPFA